ncbi:IMP cyclohydrolase [Candidatus Bathyarchaeota archaeon]|nr:IMP cyclohydrolase [Candidatus Bathyarchaeota archaeon]
MNIKRALISVYNKTGIINFCNELTNFGIEIIATGGTLTILKEGGIKEIKHVSDVTNFPEILNGRVKTEHPKIIGGILARKEKKEHMNELERFGIKPIDLVVCNIYPFEKFVDEERNLEIILEKIDIGGPNMIRAAAKNHKNVIVIVNPNRYDQVLQELKEKGDVSVKTRLILASEAFKLTARYDLLISNFLEKTVFL